MVQRRQCLRFAREPRQAVRIEREDLRQHLNRDIAIEFRIARAIHLPHSAFAKFVHDAIGPERVTGFHCVLLGWLRFTWLGCDWHSASAWSRPSRVAAVSDGTPISYCPVAAGGKRHVFEGWSALIMAEHALRR
jgi:hypothetical protein